MALNPYQSPASDNEPPAETAPGRARAISHVRTVFLILLLPAVYNYYAFDVHAIGGSGAAPPVQGLYRTANILGFMLGGALIWYRGLPLLEWAAARIRFAVATRVVPDAWNGALYAALNRAVYLAIPGAVLWAIWVYGFYGLAVGFTAISYAIGIPAHVLGACVYVPLLLQWYGLARSAPAT